MSKPYQNRKDEFVYSRRLDWFQESPDPTWKEVKKIPSSVEEYLLGVIEERRNMPYIIRCDQYCRQENGNKIRTPYIEEIPVATAPDKLKPTTKIQKYNVNLFSNCRKYVSKMRTHPDAKVVPFKYDQCHVGWTKFFKSQKPALSRVMGLNGKQLDHGLKTLLSLLAEVKHGETIKHVIGVWLFTFLVCLKLPLLADTYGVLRDIARQCAEIRFRIDPDRENAAVLATPLNLFICLVGRYFRQYDLAD